MDSREGRNARQREYRKLNGNAHTKKYERTKKGFLMRKYRNMESRVKGIQKQKHHLYEGKDLLSRERFYGWAMSHPMFHRLFFEWELSGHDRKLCPTVDRIDSEKGYTISNMRWITHSENSRLGALSRYGKTDHRVTVRPRV